MEVRPRRLRQTAALRAMVTETRVHSAQLILPVFVREGATEPVPISSMPGRLRLRRNASMLRFATVMELE